MFKKQNNPALNKWESAEDLILQNVTKVFDDGHGQMVKVVNNVSFSIKKQEFLTLLGPSGCGKTTTLRMIAGFETIDSGEIYLGKEKINMVPAFARNMPMVFQSYALFPHLTIFENIAYGLKVRKVDSKTIKNDVERALQLVNLDGLENRRPGELSGGQQQRVALARALILKPQIILFDEPLSNLDAKLRAQTRIEITRIQKMLGITTIYVTHDQEEALSMSDRIVVMDKGKIVQIGTPEEIYNQPTNVFVADFIGNANIIEGHIQRINDETIVLDLEGKELKISRKNIQSTFKEKEKVFLAIKPEAVQISQNEETLFQGELYGTAFLGANMVYEIEFQNKILSSTQKHSDALPKNLPIGTKVGVHFDTDYLQILKKE